MVTMTDVMNRQVVDLFGLTSVQAEAALERERDVVLTAGAGSGKTRTLVARYTTLLADGHPPRSVVAVTFTEKAAREMRSRVRDAVRQLSQGGQSNSQVWNTLESRLDSARIGTIHSLCAELLRAHPAEAGIDPRFDVMDEGMSAVLRARAVEDCMVFLVNHPENARLFEFMETKKVRKLLKYLLEKRLEMRDAPGRNVEIHPLICRELLKVLASHKLAEPAGFLDSFSEAQLLDNEKIKLAEMVIELRKHWNAGLDALGQGDLYTCAEKFFTARRQYMNRTVGAKDSLVKQAVADLQMGYDDLLNPFLGGKQSGINPLSRESDAMHDRILTLVSSAFQYLDHAYQSALDLRHALDFDDLEYGAAQLLKNEDIRLRWQAELNALLVDEFQDTNARQREIVEGLAGRQGKLFIVGDDRQSIYRFRRADVTVFKEKQQQVRQAGGLVRNLDENYRTHTPLLHVSGDLLASVMGTEPDEGQPYYVPFSAQIAARNDMPESLVPPHVEMVYAVAENTEQGRTAAAQALAVRLLQLKQEGQISQWSDIALLFRAASGFGEYEDAFEEVGIPFVTVSGRGFYERPEIRDVLNILRAISDTADDLSMAGLLRSPAFGVSDAGLYRLRFQQDRHIPFHSALHGDLLHLDEQDRVRVQRAVNILDDILPKVDRMPVADLLKRLVDMTDYRAVLATQDSGARLWRNLDKLIDDALKSGQVNVRDFLHYISNISDVGAREGEAPAEGQGAVRLMTIHKSKGLQFPLVVLAGASRSPRGGSDDAYLLPGMGLTVKFNPPAVAYSFSDWQDGLQSKAEEQRLLYVALTRAQNKLIINGYAASKKSGSAPGFLGWMAELAEAIGLEPDADMYAQPGLLKTASGGQIRVWRFDPEAETAAPSAQVEVPPFKESFELALYHPLYEAPQRVGAEDEPDVVRAWRATGAGKFVPAAVIGEMFHKTLKLWLFADDPVFISFLESAALDAGLAGSEQRVEAVRRVRELLERFRDHTLWQEISTAHERHHEVPYARQVGAVSESGYIDLLYRTHEGWQVIDFKTEMIANAAMYARAIKEHQPQMERYASAARALLGQPVAVRICFLDYSGHVDVVDPQV